MFNRVVQNGVSLQNRTSKTSLPLTMSTSTKAYVYIQNAYSDGIVLPRNVIQANPGSPGGVSREREREKKHVNSSV